MRPVGPQRRSLPHPGQLRRERRALLRAREGRLRDLGGLMLEMFRRDQFRQDLLVERCDELLALVVVGIVLSLLGLWIFSIPIGLVAVVLFVLFLTGWGRRATTRTPDTPA